MSVQVSTVLGARRPVSIDAAIVDRTGWRALLTSWFGTLPVHSTLCDGRDLASIDAAVTEATIPNGSLIADSVGTSWEMSNSCFKSPSGRIVIKWHCSPPASSSGRWPDDRVHPPTGRRPKCGVFHARFGHRN